MDQIAFELLTKDWQVQDQMDSCLPSCMINITNDLQTDFQGFKIKFKAKEMKSICDYRPHLGSSPDVVVKNLNNEFKRRGAPFKCAESNGTINTIDALRNIILDKDKSFPLISLSQDYFEEIGLSIEGRNPFDHVIAVLAIEDGKIWFHDPYKPFAMRSSRVKTFNNHLPYVTMLKYWKETQSPNWVMWVERVAGTLDRWLVK
ncbi:MAG TPA: hypothetical protein PKM11_05355 [Methanomassiliicoccales archaeon]|nr:hypothetical protein [Methanomassiliicoccales archaeon]